MTATKIAGRMPREAMKRHPAERSRSAAKGLEYIKKNATATATVMVMGKLWKRPPSLNTEKIAAMPAPRTMPERSAEGITRTTFEANPVMPRTIENRPSMSWKLMSAHTRSRPSGKP